MTTKAEIMAELRAIYDHYAAMEELPVAVPLTGHEKVERLARCTVSMPPERHAELLDKERKLAELQREVADDDGGDYNEKADGLYLEATEAVNRVVGLMRALRPPDEIAALGEALAKLLTVQHEILRVRHGR